MHREPRIATTTSSKQGSTTGCGAKGAGHAGPRKRHAQEVEHDAGSSELRRYHQRSYTVLKTSSYDNENIELRKT